jgi:hypothetical protein
MKMLLLVIAMSMVTTSAFAVKANGGLLRDKNGTIIGTTAFRTVQVKAYPTAENPDPQGRYWTTASSCGGSSHNCSTAEALAGNPPHTVGVVYLCCSYTLVKKRRVDVTK